MSDKSSITDLNDIYFAICELDGYISLLKEANRWERAAEVENVRIQAMAAYARLPR